MAKKPPPPPAEVPSEDELRTKVVYPFLLEQGFAEGDVKVEFAFELRRGRILDHRPRTDALVTKNGIAIFVIECKREDFDLTTVKERAPLCN